MLCFQTNKLKDDDDGDDNNNKLRVFVSVLLAGMLEELMYWHTALTDGNSKRKYVGI